MIAPLSEEFLIERGYCCGNGCTNCPYEPRHGRTTILRKSVARKLTTKK